MRFEEFRTLHDINFEIPEGKLLLAAAKARRMYPPVPPADTAQESPDKIPEILGLKAELDRRRFIDRELDRNAVVGMTVSPGGTIGGQVLSLYLEKYTEDVSAGKPRIDVSKCLTSPNAAGLGVEHDPDLGGYRYQLDDKNIEIAGLKKQLTEAEGQRDRLNVQLAGCLAVAEGHVDSPCEPRTYGWSLAYEKTLWLRREVADLRAMLPRLGELCAGHSLRERVAKMEDNATDISDLRNHLFSLTQRFDELAWRLGALEVRKPQTTYHGGPWAVPCDAPQDYPERHDGTGSPPPQDVDKGTGSPPPQDADKGSGSPPPRWIGSVCETKKVDAKPAR